MSIFGNKFINFSPNKLYMEVSKKIIFVPHCILNINVNPEYKEHYSSAIKELIDLLTEAGIGIVQMPCPEVEFMGTIKRERQPKSFYTQKKYRDFCKKIAKIIIKQIESYIKEGYKVVGILGVELSPSCAVHQVSYGNKISPGKGVLIEEIENEMKKKTFQVPIVGVNLNNIYATIEKIHALIKYS